MKALVAGGGGFIGGHLTQRLLEQGYEVRCVDIKPLYEWDQVHKVENETRDLRLREECLEAVEGVDQVFMLAADMGGMGFIETHKLQCMLSSLITTHMLVAASLTDSVQRFFYSSSACVYRADRQTEADVVALREEDAYPAQPEDGYGWEKLFGERMCRHFFEDSGLVTRVARFHNVYGPYGTYKGGREKAPAAICRKVIEAKLSGKHEIEIWGDGEQTRSFMYVDDCTKGISLITNSDIDYPINLGSDELVTINQLVSIAEDFAGVKLERHYNLDAPKGVRGRNSDNTLIKKELKWAPSISLVDGMRELYTWIESEMT